MDYLILANFIANVVIAISMSLFLIFLFGRENSLVYKLRFLNTLGLRLGIVLCICGTFLSALTFTAPPISEIATNTGFAFVFCWAAWFHYNRFVKHIPASKMAKSRRTK